jgi:2-polyprenyl-3-methyl-5-hydroxy-6-metoxy-1,4-benzoquinol methylase
MEPELSEKCPVCGQQTHPLCSKRGKVAQREFHLRRCERCGLSYVADPWTDYSQIYDDAYYEGRGADPMIDYVFDLNDEERSVRTHEWQGVVRLVGSLVPLSSATSWIDFGCGSGGLVRHVTRATQCQIAGFDHGAIVEKARKAGIKIMDTVDLDAVSGSVDVVTALDVLEHAPDPVGLLQRIRRLLRPGGLLLATTANATPFRAKLCEWDYVVPEIHVSFFEPRTLATAFEAAGFRPEFRGWMPGMTEIFRAKILKNLHLGGERKAWQSLVPWPVVARLADRIRELSALPIAWAV